MPKAAPKSTLRGRARRVASVTSRDTPSKQPRTQVERAAARDGVMRLFSHDPTDAAWHGRSPTSKLSVVSGCIAERLAGMAELCDSLSTPVLINDGRRSDGPPSPHFEAHRCLAHSLRDMAKALQAANAVYWDHIRAEEDAATEANRRG